MEKYKKAGVNRLSIGLQSADDEELQILGRIHTFEKFVKTYEKARNAGFANINVDLMSGIPYQTAEKFLHTLQKVVRLKPNHISAYSLIIEKGTPFYEKYKFDVTLQEAGKQTTVLPTEDEVYRITKLTQQYLEKAGYEQYEISNFARHGFPCIHNLKYWNCEEYLGFGPGAYSYFNSTRFSFVRNIEAYIKGVADPQSRVNLTEGLEEISGRAQLGEYIMLGLRLSDGISVSEIARRYGVDFAALYGKKADKYIKYGYMTYKGDRIALTPSGMFISNHILSDILSFEDLGALSPAGKF